MLYKCVSECVAAIMCMLQCVTVCHAGKAWYMSSLIDWLAA